MGAPQKNILLADRSLEDWRILMEVMSQIDRTIKIKIVTRTEHLLQYLAKCDESELPCLIVLDHNLPAFDGLKTLQRMKAERLYEKIPKIVWSASINSDVESLCLEAGAAHCFTKPSRASELKAIARDMVNHCHKSGYFN